MNMSDKEYDEYIKKISPSSRIFKNTIKAFVSGGLICCVGQAFLYFYEYLGLEKDLSAASTSITMIFLGALLTGMGIYDKLAHFSGAGTLVPITGFANAVVSPALEFKSEGLVTGTAAKMFVISGPVIVFGVTASVLYGFILILFGL